MQKIFDLFKKIKLPQVRRPRIGPILFWVVSLVLVALAFSASRSIFRCWEITQLPGISPASCTNAGTAVIGTPVVNEQGTPVAAPPTPVPAPPEVQLPTWDGASRINILFIGLDYRDYIANDGPPRTDTMILFTVDPQSKTAGMLSIPRDLWVNIPGYGFSRINTAYPTGEGNQLPGGGAGLAMRTVEQLIGVPVHYYGSIDFHAFEEAIDSMGGLYICIREKLRIDPIGDKKPEVLKPGCQTLHGYQVLAFARNRYTEKGDVDRAARQQQVIYALYTQIFNPANFPTMLARAPEIYAEASAGLRTNLAFEDLMKLGVLMRDIPITSIKHGIIDETMTTQASAVFPDGQAASVLKPMHDKIRVLRDDIFISGGPTSPKAAGDPTVLMQQDEARVRVVNSSLQADLGQRTANMLISQGMNVTEVSGGLNVQSTSVVIYGPKLYTLKYILALFGLGNNQIIFKDEASTVDIEIILGNDWMGRLPAGY
ncbi:MAG: LCP family protein [Chloroflexota bacterium]